MGGGTVTCEHVVVKGEVWLVCFYPLNMLATCYDNCMIATVFVALSKCIIVVETVGRRIHEMAVRYELESKNK